MGALRTLVVIEPGRAGDAAVREAGEQAGFTGSEVTLVAVAPQATGVRCGPPGEGYNDAVVDAVARDLARALDRLATVGVDVTCRILVDGRDPPLEEFAAAGRFGLILRPPAARGGAPRATRPNVASPATRRRRCA